MQQTSPYVDEYTTVIEAAPDTVWRALGEALDGAFSSPRAARYATLVGCADRTASGPRPPAEGSTIPGFRAVTAIEGEELALRGRHYFSTYTLAFHLEPAAPGRVLLRARTHARFPGPLGTLYRLLVITSGTHATLTRRLLTSIRCHAELL